MQQISKEEILDKYDGYKVHATVSKDCAYKAMDEFGKQQSIAFAEWIIKTNWGEKDTWGKYDTSPIPTTEQLYELFLKTQP